MKFSILVTLFLSATLALNSSANDSVDSRRAQELEGMLTTMTQTIRQMGKKISEMEKELHSMQANSNQDTEGRVDDLEQEVMDLSERIGSRAVVQAFDGQVLDFGGFIHTAFTYIDAEDSSASSFDRQNFEILIKANLTRNWSAFFAGGFLRESDDPYALGSRTDPKMNSRNKNPQIISWTNFAKSDALNVRLGRFITPIGIINIQHFPAILLDPEQPQFLRPFSGDKIFPNFSTGIQIHGKKFVGKDAGSEFQYTGFISNFVGHQEEEVFGGRLSYGRNNATFGVNVVDGERATGSSYTVTGADLLYEGDHVIWKSEYYHSDESIGKDRSGWYTQPSIKFARNWTVFYRYDFLDDGISDVVENILGLNFTPKTNIRLRLNATYKSFDSGIVPTTGVVLPESDATILQFSGTFSY